MYRDKSQKALFVGIGGGNDAFSAILAARSLKRVGYEWDEYAFAGVLSPFHHHTTTEIHIPGASLVKHDSMRFLLAKDGGSRIGFVDAAIARLLGETSEFEGAPLFGLSLKDGSIGLAQTFEVLAQIYGTIVLVDVGGDCFYQGSTDTHVLSPMFDAIVLNAFVKSRVPGMLFETGAGTDGEIDPEPLEKAIGGTSPDTYFLHPDDMSAWEKLYETYISPVRKGNTVPATIQAFKSEEPVIEREYRARAHVDKLRLYSPFTQRINTGLAKKFFLIEPSSIRNPFAIDCTNPFDWFMKTQVALNRTNCEANHELLYQDRKLGRFLTPSPLFESDGRRAIVTYGIDRLIYGKTDFVWMFPDDFESIDPDQKAWLIPSGDKLLTVTVKNKR